MTEEEGKQLRIMRSQIIDAICDFEQVTNLTVTTLGLDTIDFNTKETPGLEMRVVRINVTEREEIV